MNPHTRGRDPARAPARAEEPKAGKKRDPWAEFENWRMRMWSKMLFDEGLRAHNSMVRARRAKA